MGRGPGREAEKMSNLEKMESLAKTWNHAGVSDLIVFVVNGRNGKYLMRYYNRGKRVSRLMARIVADGWPESAIRHSDERAPAAEFAAN